MSEISKWNIIAAKESTIYPLQRIREIRLSERRFYQKITDIYATSIDYDPKANLTLIIF